MKKQVIISMYDGNIDEIVTNIDGLEVKVIDRACCPQKSFKIDKPYRTIKGDFNLEGTFYCSECNGLIIPPCRVFEHPKTKAYICESCFNNIKSKPNTYVELLNHSDYNTPERWVCTDPDNFQFCYKLANDYYVYRQFKIRGSGVYISDENYKEYWDDSNLWDETPLKLSRYSQSEINEAAFSFYSGKQINEFWETKNYQLLLECVFEYNL